MIIKNLSITCDLNNYRSKYYNKKRLEMEQLVKIPVNKINIDILRNELYYKWGHSLKIDIVLNNNKLHLKVEKKLYTCTDYDNLNVQLEDLNIGNYLIEKIKMYPLEDILDTVYINLE